MNTIFIHDLRLETKVGVYAWERELAQTIRVDLDIGLPSTRPFETGELADAIDYAAVVSRIRAFAQEHPHALLERFAEAIASLVLDGALDLALRSDADDLQELANAEVERLFVHEEPPVGERRCR